MADFNIYLPMLLKFEGGWVDNPYDPGGSTNKGITFGTFREFAPKILHLSPTIENLRALTDEQAGKIYKSEYWDPIFGDEIQFQPLANIICDFHVNAGFHAIILLIHVLNMLGSNHAPGGHLTRKIMDSLNYHDSVEVYMHYKAGRIGYYRTLAQENPALRRFLAGWLNRVNAFPNFSVQPA
ncbi:glycoside hydrolase family 108 protein [Leeia sp.]|uniref:glycoside hydrolase family 108 protein n=1 Tax=Leeia sp. TaxID=2884678 RepID=UPI0035B464E1